MLNNIQSSEKETQTHEISYREEIKKLEDKILQIEDKLIKSFDLMGALVIEIEANGDRNSMQIKKLLDILSK